MKLRLFLLTVAMLASLSLSPAARAEFFTEQDDASWYQQSAQPCDDNAGFLHRLFHFRPWSEAELAPAPVRPGLPGARRYLFGNRYFGPFGDRYYGPQYGNF